MSDTAITMTKASITIVLSLFFKGIWGLIIPLGLLIICMLADYITGLMASSYKGEKITSAKSIKGIYKKCSMLILVITGAIIDMLILYMTQMAGFELGITYNCLISCIICLWLDFNELISITENLRDMDTPVPFFMMPLLKLIKDKTERAVDIPDSEKKE